jgi:hypothetical protein
VDWGTLVATISGAVIAIGGTVLADRLRTRHDDGRGRQDRRRDVYLHFIAAAGACHTRLRAIAQDPRGAGALEEASRAALADTGLYDARERLFIEASPAVAKRGQEMFERLRSLRRAVAAGARLESPAFHGAYHPYIESVWAYRVAVRQELEGQALSPAVFGWASWDSRARCPVCGTVLGDPAVADPALGGAVLGGPALGASGGASALPPVSPGTDPAGAASPAG